MTDWTERERFASPVAASPIHGSAVQKISLVLPVLSLHAPFLGFQTGRRHDHEGACR